MNDINKQNLSFALLEADRIEQLLIDSGGELTEEIELALVVSEKSLATTVDREVQKLERIEYVADYYKKKADTFLAIAKTLQLYSERREEQIKAYMIDRGLHVLKGQEYEYFLAKPTVSVDVLDVDEIPEKFVKITKTAMKTDIKKAIENGEHVPAVVLRENRSLRTRINRGKQ